MASSSKRPKEATQGPKIKFLINIPLKVVSVDQAQKTCGYLLDALKHEGFESEVNSAEDVAVIFGLNGKFFPGLREILAELKESQHAIKHSMITFTWGAGGDIATSAEDPPYQHIREYLKNHSETKRLVREMKKKDPTSLIYFSFVDSDTIHFNHIYSEYCAIVREELAKDNIPPTVMSTGYEFPTGSKFHIASWIDRMVRVATAEEFPLGTYYPEPNFCVLVPNNEDHVPESFINPARKNMESPVLISQVKKRDHFKAVFSDREPITIDVPERFDLRDKGLQTRQSHFGKRTWAISAYAHGELKNKESVRGIVGKNRKFLIDLLKIKDDAEFERKCKESPYEEHEALITAAKETRELMKVIYELDEKL